MMLPTMLAASSLGLWLNLWLSYAPILATATCLPGPPAVEPVPVPLPPKKCCGTGCRCTKAEDCANGCCDVSGSRTCVESESSCLTCASFDCERDFVCVMEQVQCIRAPCFPVPTCKPANCKALQCPPDQECYVEVIYCFVAPCPPPLAKCRPKTPCVPY